MLIFRSLSIINLIGENFSNPFKRQVNFGLSVLIVLCDVNIPWCLYLNKCDIFLEWSLVIGRLFLNICRLAEQANFPTI